MMLVVAGEAACSIVYFIGIDVICLTEDSSLDKRQIG